MASSLVGRQWVVAVNAPLKQRKGKNLPRPSFIPSMRKKGLQFEHRWTLNVTKENGQAPTEGRLSLVLGVCSFPNFDKAGTRLTVFDTDGVLAKMRDSIGKGVYSVQVELHYLNRLLTFPKLQWKTSDLLGSDNGRNYRMDLPLYDVLELLSYQIANESFTANVMLEYRGEQGKSEED